MKVFLVGGAVRDKVMGIEPNDRDFVVVGSTPEEMVERGFSQVGADFPVFLNSDGEEFALARTERKSGVGHGGFKVEFSPNVSLKDDLFRRDFTINAMAEDAEGNIIDPHGGQDDICRGIIRHVSFAFRDDPLRVLRAARFAARFGFVVHPDTINLMCEMVESGELNTLTAERVWQEVSKAMMHEMPEKFVEVLEQCGASSIVFGEKVWEFLNDNRKMIQDLPLFKLEESTFWMSLFHSDHIAAEAVVKQFKMPSKLAEQIVFSADVANIKSPEDALKLCLKFKLWNKSRHSLLVDALDCMRIFAGSEDFILFSKLVLAIRDCAHVGFSDLSENEQIVLRGPEIGSAIMELRKHIIEQVWH